MNLFASEYVACQEARHGVLVLSEFTGAAAFMKHGSLLFNPPNADGLSNALYDAITAFSFRKIYFSSFQPR
jgi:trehalose 6-phosphate synthase